MPSLHIDTTNTHKYKPWSQAYSLSQQGHGTEATVSQMFLPEVGVEGLVIWYTPLTSFEHSGEMNSGVDWLTTRDFVFTVQLLDETAPFGTWRTNPCPFLRSKVRSSFPLNTRCSSSTTSTSGTTTHNSAHYNSEDIPDLILFVCLCFSP